MEQRTQFETLLQLHMLDAGLVPHSSIFSDVLKEVKAYMATLEPSDRRRSARKFRKMWRKAAAASLARATKMKANSKFQKSRRARSLAYAQDRVEGLYAGVEPTKRQQRALSHRPGNVPQADSRRDGPAQGTEFSLVNIY